MRRARVQHGPTCRAVTILAVCVAIVGFCNIPRAHYRAQQLDLRDSNDPRRSWNRQDDNHGKASSEEATVNEDGAITSQADDERVQPQTKASNMKNQGSSSSSSSSIHVILTSNGSPYMNWQSRIMYHSFLKVASMAGSDMKYFTRVLHRASDDALMDTMPTLRVNPLDPSCDTWCEYPVASRPYAIQQWLDSDDPKGDWVAMIETDYVFVKPLQVPSTGRALGFPFGYIAPLEPSLEPILRKFYPAPRPLADLPATGNAPVVIRTEDLRKVVPIWVKVTAQIEEDEEAKNKLGWVREMYAFSLSTALAGVKIDLPPMPGAIMSQPPADEVVGDASILHYTWGSVIKDEMGVKIWEFDKRVFTDKGLPDPIPEPPEDKASESQKVLITLVNSAIRALPKYTPGELREMGRTDGEVQAAAKAERDEFSRISGGRIDLTTRNAGLVEQGATLAGGVAAEGSEGEGGEGGVGGEGAGSVQIGGREEGEKWRGGGRGEGGSVVSAWPRVEVVAITGQQTPHSIHVIITSNGNPYMNWQTQIAYFTYKQVAAKEGSGLQFFTRVLHRTKDDELSTRVPTVRVTPLHPECDNWCEYPVADRPFAIQQWLTSGDVRGDWVLMAETDYLFVRPISIPSSGRALGFPFGYIIPTWPTIRHIMIRYFAGDLADIPQTGNSPLLLPASDLARLVPHWVAITAKFEDEEDSKKDLGWIREMYAFSIAAARISLQIDLPPVPNAIMVQPPADTSLGAAAIIHYTWASEVKDESGKVVWKWDKRDWTQPGSRPTRIPQLPQGASELQRLMVDTLNEAIGYVFR